MSGFRFLCNFVLQINPDDGHIKPNKETYRERDGGI